MGHTVWSQRVAVDLFLDELKAYGRSLPKEEKIIYDQLLNQPLKHVGSITYTSSMQLWALTILSILIEQQKQINDAHRRLHAQQ